ncbi:MAG: CBS domain-containing protein [Candidatus Omnitrophota bacterium]
MIAGDIMTREVKTVNPQMQIRELAAFFVEENISGAPVINASGRFLGIVTEEDLIYQDKKVHLPTFLNLFSSIFAIGLDQMEEEFKKIAATNVEQIMQTNSKIITKETTIEEIATIMSEDKAYYLVVMEQGKIEGIITKRDLIKAVAKGKIW